MDPVAVAEIITPEPWCPGDPIEFDGSDSYDQDEGGDSIVSWEWDFDGDGVYGDPYDSGTDQNPTKIFSDLGAYEINLLVTDNEGATDTLDTPLSLTVGGEPTWVDDDAVPPYDGSFENPWPTIQDGIDNASGDCGDKLVLVKDGTYEEYINFISNITVEGYSTLAPLIQGPDVSSSTVVNMSVSNSTIKHFQLKPRTTGYGINLVGSNNTVDDIEFLDNPGGLTCSYGVRASGTGNTVENVRTDGYHITAGGGTSFIYVSGGDSTVVDCVILNIDFNNADSGWGPNVFTFTSGNSSSLYARNVAGHYTISGPVDTHPRVRAFLVSGCNGSTIRNNLVFDYENNQTGGWTRVFELSGLSNLTVERNTVSGVSGPAWIYGMYAPSGDSSTFTLRNNIITNLTAGTMNWRSAHKGNLNPDYPVGYSCTYNVGDDFNGNFIAGTGFLSNQNPLFTNPSNDDYTLQSGSPCKNAAHDGTDMGAYGGADPLTWMPD